MRDEYDFSKAIRRTDRQTVLIEYQDDLPFRINGFFKNHRALSNFHLEKFEWKGVTWAASENAYQAAKFIDQASIFKSFADLDPKDAKTNGRRYNITTQHWDVARLFYMEEVLTQKFTQCPEAIKVLLSTEDKELIENNWWRDVFWGRCSNVGENNLGRLLMKVRLKIR